MFKESLCLSVLCLLVVATSSNAMTAEQKATIHEHFEKIGMECFKDNAITPEDVANLRARKLATGPNVPCFMACMYKDIGVLDDAGKIQKEHVLELAKKVFNDEEELKLIDNYLHSCAHVNDAAVGDGAKGCERAMLGYKCMLENAAQFGFDV